MGYRIVRFSGELFEMILTEGYTLPDSDGRRIRVTKGLPEGAKFEGISHDLEYGSGRYTLLFSHPSWPDQNPGELVPAIPLEFTLERFDSADTPAVVGG